MLFANLGITTDITLKLKIKFSKLVIIFWRRKITITTQLFGLYSIPRFCWDAVALVLPFDSCSR